MAKQKIYIVLVEECYMCSKSEFYFKGAFTTIQGAEKAMQRAKEQYSEKSGYYLHCKEFVCDRFVERLSAKFWNWGRHACIPVDYRGKIKNMFKM